MFSVRLAYLFLSGGRHSPEQVDKKYQNFNPTTGGDGGSGKVFVFMAGLNNTYKILDNIRCASIL